MLMDHKPKLVVLDVWKKKWRRAFEAKQVPRVRCEALKNEVIAKSLMETAESTIGAMEEGRGDSTR